MITSRCPGVCAAVTFATTGCPRAAGIPKPTATTLANPSKHPRHPNEETDFIITMIGIAKRTAEGRSQLRTAETVPAQTAPRNHEKTEITNEDGGRTADGEVAGGSA